MISRIWHGWTTPANADAYEQLLRSEIFAGILGRGIAGFRRIQLLRRPAGDGVEFVTEQAALAREFLQDLLVAESVYEK